MAKKKLEDYGYEALDHLSEDRSLMRSKEIDLPEAKMGAINANATSRAMDSTLRVKKHNARIAALRA